VAALEVPPQRIIHVAGTNGKGSTCAMMASIAQAAGLRVGLFTSPHLISYCERIRVNGAMITEAAVTAGLERIKALVQDWDPHPTFFELTTALALDYFSQEKTDLIVLETGMGGRLDATNIVTPLVSVITPIALDHQQWLGGTIEAIAAEKAGIMKPGVPTVSASQAPGVAAVLRAHGPVDFVQQRYCASPIALLGAHQQENAALAVLALESAGYHFQPSTIAAGLAQTQWPARFQRCGNITIDGAHNPAGATVLAAAWQSQFPNQQVHLICGAVAAKDVRQVMEILRPIVASVHFVTLQSPRAMPAADLLAIWQEVAPGIPAVVSATLALALSQAPPPTLVAGSLYLCGEALALLAEEATFEVSAQ
jgi:dihydrofolate synthase / folylpolyglutamate synthase